MSDVKLYGHREEGTESDFYMQHVMAMTGEKLHSKAEIAAELAYRDQRIAELEAAAQAYLKAEKLADECTADGKRNQVRNDKLDALAVVLASAEKIDYVKVGLEVELEAAKREIERLQIQYDIVTGAWQGALNRANDKLVFMRRDVDKIKVRSYELGQKELHDMAWDILKDKESE